VIPRVEPDRRLVALRLRALHGRELLVRASSADRGAVIGTFSHRFHLPRSVPEPRLIWDLGANIGTTMAHMAALFEDARIVGVELDADNADLCRRNVAEWQDRCSVITAAIWPRDGRLAYDTDTVSEQAYRVAGESPKAGGNEKAVEGLSLNTLRARTGSDAVDFVKMDIEGAETRVLRENTEWAEAVTEVQVEVHAPYTVEECAADLRALGFVAAIDPKHDAAVWGTRRPRGSAS
jgi:FkbM family methyltransferase